MWSIIAFLCLLGASTPATNAFSRPHPTFTTMSTTTASPKTDRRTSESQKTFHYEEEKNDSLSEEASRRGGPLEYLKDEMATRENEDPFHILLLGSTFEKPRITTSYVAGSLSYVLGMPENEALELSQMAEQNGMSCLGTWERIECLSLGRKLQVRDIVCRVVPFVNGGQRGWQARDVGGGVGAGANV